MTPTTLAQSLGIPLSRADKWALPITRAMLRFGIDTPARQAAFLAQIGHESAGLRHVREIWGPTPAQLRYEGRKDLGNTVAGDGKRFMGRGLIQITGRHNYAQAGRALELPLLQAPELLEQPQNAAHSAGWYWSSRNLNRFADSGDFRGLTRAINGGYNGMDDRLRLWDMAKAALSQDAPASAPAVDPFPWASGTAGMGD